MATVSANLKRDRKGKYKAELTVDNPTSTDLTDWTIVANLTDTSSIDSAKNCTLEAVGSTVTIIPGRKVATVEAGKSEEIDIAGVSPMPTDFKLVTATGPGGPTGPSGDTGATGPVNYVIDMPMTNYTDMKQVSEAGGGNTWQYSYDKQSSPSETVPNPAYISLAGDNGLKLCLYKSDKPFKVGSNTFPRTELRNRSVIKDNVAYTLSFDRYLVNAPTFDFSWFQVFGGDNPNLIFRWRSGSYEVLSLEGDDTRVKFAGNPSQEVGVWVNWTTKFYLSKTNGWLQLYRNGVMVASYSKVDNAGGGDSYLKLGCYAQQMDPSNDVVTYIKNLQLYF